MRSHPLAFEVVSYLAAVAIVMPVFLLGAVVLCVLFFAITLMYISTSRELKRLESITRSPIFGLVGESLNGITTIRAYGSGPRFFRKLFAMLDDNARPYWNLWLANRWSVISYLVWSQGDANCYGQAERTNGLPRRRH